MKKINISLKTMVTHLTELHDLLLRHNPHRFGKRCLSQLSCNEYTVCTQSVGR